MTSAIDRRCDLCGHVGQDVEWGLLAYGEETAGRFDSGPRCRDREACRGRLESAGEAWSVRDRGRDPAVPAHPEAGRNPVAEDALAITDEQVRELEDLEPEAWFQ